MAELREFFRTKAGRVVAIGLVLVGAAALVWSISSNFGPSDAVNISSERMFVCSETGKAFEYTLVAGDKVPIQSPHSGKRTGYPAELCYWTKDGKIKESPTAVLMNSALNKPGPTFCPDCDRLVIQWNPRPVPDAKPPPLKSEYKGRAPAAPAE
jgi:hypothetical protein